MAQGPVDVAFVLPSFAGGGAERVTLTLAAGLDRARFAPCVVVLDPSGPLRERGASTCPVLALNRPRLRQAFPALVAALRKARPRVVVSTFGYVNLALLAARPFLPPAMRLVVREANEPAATIAALPMPALARLAYRRLYARADAVIAPSARIAQCLAREHGVAAGKLAVLANPVDVAALRAAAAHPKREPGNGLRFVAVGRLTPQKGFDRLLALLAELREPAHVTIFGEGPERERLAAQAAALGVAASVRFAGFSADVPAWLAGADALLLPSRWEGMPNAALEALAVGTPVVATPEAGGIAEVAADAPPGAVAIAAAGPDFATAMAAAKARVPGVGPCLLPVAFHRDDVLGRFESLLARVAA